MKMIGGAKLKATRQVEGTGAGIAPDTAHILDLLLTGPGLLFRRLPPIPLSRNRNPRLYFLDLNAAQALAHSCCIYDPTLDNSLSCSMLMVLGHGLSVARSFLPPTLKESPPA